MFKDRKEAGKKLAKCLEKYREKNVQILAIPRGGVEVGYQVAKYLNAEFSIIISRKLPYPYNPEAGFGAIAEDGSFFIFQDAKIYFTEEEIESIIREQIEEIKRRIQILRKGKHLLEIEGRIVVLIDDGIAMGSTMKAAIKLCKNRKAEKIIVAVPVTGKEVAREIEREVDELIVIETPEYFHAVAQVYKNWYDVSDKEVLEIIEGRK